MSPQCLDARSCGLSVDIPRRIDFYRTGRLKLAERLAARFPLEQIDQAIATAGRGAAARNVILFE